MSLAEERADQSLLLLKIFPAHQWPAPSVVTVFMFITVALNTPEFMTAESSCPSITKYGEPIGHSVIVHVHSVIVFFTCHMLIG